MSYLYLSNSRLIDYLCQHFNSRVYDGRHTTIDGVVYNSVSYCLNTVTDFGLHGVLNFDYFHFSAPGFELKVTTTFTRVAIVRPDGNFCDVY